MIPSASIILDKLAANGWEVIERREISYLWVSEIWKVGSKWSPTDFILYLSFEVYAENDSQDFGNVGWLKATRTPPIDWARSGTEIDLPEEDVRTYASTPLGRKQEKYLESFFDSLSEMRIEFGVKTKK